MPRQRRLQATQALHHLIARFVNREFRLGGAEERVEYLRRVPAVLSATDARPQAFALMSNHVHWALVTGDAPVTRFVHPLHVGIAGWLNRMQGRTGPVFMERFTSLLCDEERTAILLAYLHNNPVRARVVTDPVDSDWTSHRAFIGLDPAPPWLDVEAGLAASGFNASPSGRLAFHAFVLSRLADPRDAWMSGDEARESRRLARKALGAPVDVTDAMLGHPDAPIARDVVSRVGGVVRPRWPGAALEVVRRVCAATASELSDVRARDRRSQTASARRVALWAWARELGREQAEMNSVVGFSSGGGSKLLRRTTQAERVVAARVARDLWDELRLGSETALAA